MAIERFEDLDVWTKARTLTKRVYEVSGRSEFGRDYPMRNQIRRAAISIGSNLAEGFERGGNKEFHQFLVLAKGSAGEVRAQLYMARDVGFLSQPEFDELCSLAVDVSEMISGLMRYLKRSELKGIRYSDPRSAPPSNPIRELDADYGVELDFLQADEPDVER